MPDLTSWQAISPWKHPSADVFSEWRGEELWWNINGRWVSDAELRSWCYQNLWYPWCYIDCVRAIHVNSWAAHQPKEPRA